MGRGKCLCHLWVWTSEDNLLGLILFLYHVYPEYQTQVISLTQSAVNFLASCIINCYFLKTCEWNMSPDFKVKLACVLGGALGELRLQIQQLHLSWNSGERVLNYWFGVSIPKHTWTCGLSISMDGFQRWKLLCVVLRGHENFSICSRTFRSLWNLAGNWNGLGHQQLGQKQWSFWRSLNKRLSHCW